MKLRKLGKKVIFDSHECYYKQMKCKEYLSKAFRNLIAEIFYIYESSVARKLDGGIMFVKTDGKGSFEKCAKRERIAEKIKYLISHEKEAEAMGREEES